MPRSRCRWIANMSPCTRNTVSVSVLLDVAMNVEESEAGGERDGGPPFANVHSVPTFHNTRNMYVNQTWKILFSKGGLISQGIKFYRCCRNQYLRNEAPDLESWRTQVYSAGGPRGVKTPSSELQTKGLRGFYIWTGMIKRVCGFAGARAIAKSRTRVGEISSSS